jgi:hypothetical protein
LTWSVQYGVKNVFVLVRRASLACQSLNDVAVKQVYTGKIRVKLVGFRDQNFFYPLTSEICQCYDRFKVCQLLGPARQGPTLQNFLWT